MVFLSVLQYYVVQLGILSGSSQVNRLPVVRVKFVVFSFMCNGACVLPVCVIAQSCVSLCV